MKRQLLAVLLCGALAALAGNAPAKAAGITALPDCVGNPTVKPASVTLACGDAGLVANHLSWTGWGSSFAAAVGSASSNDCTPNCAAGHFHTFKIVLLAQGKTACPGGRAAYATLSYAFIGPAPYPLKSAADATIPLHCGTH